MALRYQLHPALGVARIGNSPDSFYLAPEAIGALPVECDEHGNPRLVEGKPKPVEQFKDEEGRIRRQATRFRIFVFDDSKPSDPGREVSRQTAMWPASNGRFTWPTKKPLGTRFQCRPAT